MSRFSPTTIMDVPGTGNRIRRETGDPRGFTPCHAHPSWYTVATGMRRHTTEIRVRYGETDKMGVAHHSSYLLWFELGRTGLLRDVGFAYRDLEAAGMMLPVMEYNCRFFRGAEYDDPVVVETTVTELRSRTVTFRYRVSRGDQLLVEGWTRHLCVTDENRPRRIPSEVIDAMTPFLSVRGGSSPRG
jgi:acyl-CoA thioester hydrolase